MIILKEKMSTLTEIKNDLKLITFPNEILKKEAKFIKNPLDLEIQKLIPKMFEIMEKEKGVGLAAPQVNFSLRLITIKIKEKKIVLINPEIISHSEKMVVYPEGCLSLPGKEFPIVRYGTITVEFTNELGKKRKIKTSGLLAIVFQHEIDHLDGILMSDRFEEQRYLREELRVGKQN